MIRASDKKTNDDNEIKAATTYQAEGRKGP